jgi:hypothetical protein
MSSTSTAHAPLLSAGPFCRKSMYAMSAATVPTA